MIRHIVMWKVRGETAQQRRTAAEAVRASFHSLRGKIPGLLSLEVGIDHSQEDHSCDVVLLSDFSNQGALDRYAGHPEHLRVRMILDGLRTSRHQVDYEVQA